MATPEVFNFTHVYLGVPLGVEFAAIPGYLWLHLGGQLEAPLYSAYPGIRPSYRFEERNGSLICILDYVQARNSSGRYLRSLPYGGHLSARLAVN